MGMNLKVFERLVRPEPSPVYFKLVQEGETVRVVVTNDRGGMEQPIISFYENGTFYRHSNVSIGRRGFKTVAFSNVIREYNHDTDKDDVR